MQNMSTLSDFRVMTCAALVLRMKSAEARLSWRRPLCCVVPLLLLLPRHSE